MKTMTENRVERSSINRVLVSSVMGTAIEWYDFFLYATASALVFGKLFFPVFDPMVGTIAAFGTFAVSYFARPLGAVFFGHLGDRIGRKAALVTTLTIMGVCTFVIGLLPNYDTIGVWAPALLIAMRFCQGLAVGGEWGGAVLLVVESAPAHRHGFYGSFPQLGVPLGLIISTFVFKLVPLHRGFDRLAPEAVRSGKGCSRQNGARDEDSARITQEDQAWDQTNDLMAHLASTGQNLCAEVLVGSAERTLLTNVLYRKLSARKRSVRFRPKAVIG